MVGVSIAYWDRMKRSLLLFLISVLASRPLHAAPLALIDLVRLAVEHSPDFQSFVQEVKIREADRSNAIAGFLPSVDLVSTQGFQSSDGSGKSAGLGSELSIALKQTVFDGGNSILSYRNAHLQKQMAELSLQNARDLLTLSVCQAVSDFSLNAILLQVQREQFELVEKQSKTIESQYRSGVRTRKDFLRFNTETKRTAIDLRNSENSLEKNRIEVERLTGFSAPGLTSKEIQPLPIDDEIFSHVPMETPNLSTHPRTRLVALQSDVLSNNITRAHLDFWPKLSIGAAGASVENDWMGSGRGFGQTNGTTWSVLAKLEWNLMDWGIRRRNISIAEATKLKTEALLQQSLLQFRAQNETLMVSIAQTHQNLKLAHELLGLETEAYMLLQSEYRNGKVSYLDLIVGLRDLLGSKVRYYTAYFELKRLLFQYRYHQGRLYESLQGVS